MQSRWSVLGFVVVARTAMAFQFRSATAVGPLLVADLGLSYAQLGTLIGFYLLPGAILAMPGGFLGARFGDRAVVLSALGQPYARRPCCRGSAGGTIAPG